MMTALARDASGPAKDLGVAVIDVEIKRMELPDDVRDSYYERMRAERTRVAADLRAKGAEEGGTTTGGTGEERGGASPAKTPSSGGGAGEERGSKAKGNE